MREAVTGKLWGKRAGKGLPCSPSYLLRLMSLLAFVQICSCTVLEERDNCPSSLAVDFTGVDRGIKEWQMWLFNEEGELLLKDTIHRRSYSAPYIVQVPRYGSVRCLMWGNMRDGTIVQEKYSYSTSISKVPGVSADSIYSFAASVNTRGEESCLEVVPCKEYATVDIYVEGWAGSDFEADMVLECASSGFYVGKEFLRERSYTNAQLVGMDNSKTHFRFRMLRQEDTENLVLNLHMQDLNPDGSPGEVIIDNEVPIGEYLYENGYDMQKESLEDISMELDYTFNRFVIKTANWEATYHIKTEI